MSSGAVAKAYDVLYLDTIVQNQASLFEYAWNQYSRFDIYDFIRVYMNSNIRKLLDVAWPGFASTPDNELWDAFLKETGYQPKTMDKQERGPFVFYWMGHLYAYYQWYWNVSSAELVTLLPPEQLVWEYRASYTDSYEKVCSRFPPDMLRERNK